MRFKLETHMHTLESSACGHVLAKDQVSQYIENGYSGIIVTDHFVNGNSAVDRSLPWNLQMKQQFAGFKNAYKASLGTGFKVYEGTEFAYNGTEFIVIGLGEKWFTDNPSVASMRPEEFLPIFRNEGAAIIQAHPFRREAYIKEIRLYPELVDAIEVFNLGNKEDSWNYEALELAKKHNKPCTAGSDCHYIGRLGAGILLDEMPENEAELASVIKSGEGWEIFGDRFN